MNKNSSRSFVFASFGILAIALSNAWGNSSYYHYLQGAMHERMGEYGQAVQEYTQAIETDPQAVFVQRQLSELQLRLGKTDDALLSAQAAVRLDPKNAESHVLLANVLLAQGKKDQALESYQTALKLDPTHNVAMLQTAWLLSDRKPQESLQWLQKYAAQDPDDPEIYLRIGQLEQGRKNHPAAIKAYRRAWDLDEDFLAAGFALAQAYEIVHDTASAVKTYEEITEKDPDNVSLWNHLGALRYEERQWGQAEQAFEHALAVSPNDPTAHFWIALIGEAQSDWPKATRHLEAALPKNGAGTLLLRLGYYFSQQGKTKEAIRVLERARTERPQDSEVHYFLALGYLDQKDFKKAERSLTAALAQEPELTQARYQLASLYDRQGKFDKAVEQFREILSREPDHAASLNYLGYSYAERGVHLDEAETLVKKALVEEPDNGAYADSLGWVYFRQGRLALAAEQLSKAADLTQDAVVWDHLGDAYSGLGKPLQAWRSYEESLGLNPKQRAVQKKADRLEKSLSLGDLWSATLERSQENRNRLGGFSGLFTVTGQSPLWDRRLLQGKAAYQSPDSLRIDLFGPLMPQLTLERKQDRLSVTPAALGETWRGEADMLTGLLLEYFSKGLFRDRLAQAPAESLDNRKNVLVYEQKDVTLELDKSRGAPVLCRFLRDGKPMTVTFFDFVQDKGVWIPRRMNFRGEGLRLDLRLALGTLDVKARKP